MGYFGIFKVDEIKCRKGLTWLKESYV